MKTNYKAMLRTANDKYAKLLDAIYQTKNGQSINYDQIISLIHSMHNDELELIFEVCTNEEQDNVVENNKVIQIPSFMHW